MGTGTGTRPMTAGGAWEAITSSVDDSSIERSSTFKQLASWGGFRRHFINEGEGKEEGHVHTGEAPPDAAAAVLSGGAEAEAEVWRQRLHDQLIAKRAEVQATQRKLESLSLEQQQLEQLFIGNSRVP